MLTSMNNKIFTYWCKRVNPMQELNSVSECSRLGNTSTFI
ncbi:unnamed protein product [Larinioides sclopetarius]|uniref:Uncharacterized protein n=1 Tax=Larinioides sclopetarius TaxID=280406 RepID=A0AAV2BYQ8_9ARAC